MDEADPPRKIGKYTPLSLTDALQKTVPKIKKHQRENYLKKLLNGENIKKDPENIFLVDFVLKHPLSTQKLQQKYNVRWVVTQTRSINSRKKTRMIYDGSRSVNDNESSPIHYFLLNRQCVLVQHTINTTEQMPPLSISSTNKHQFRHPKPLWQLLGHETNPSTQDNEPQNKGELDVYLQQYVLPKTHVEVHFFHAPTKNGTTLWTETKVDFKKLLLKVIKIFAWTKGDNQVVYSGNNDSSIRQAQQRGQKMERRFCEYQEKVKQLEEAKHQPVDPFQSNNASSINLSHSGLNLAYNLGLIKSRQDLADFSKGLANTLASLYVFVDEQNHLRHITYRDEEETFCVEVTCYDDTQNPINSYQQDLEEQRRSKAAQTMLSFWQRVWQRRQHWIQQRQHVLKPLMEHLDWLGSIEEKKMISPYSRCKTDLKKIIHLQNLFVYSKKDSHLHALKFYLADFAYQTLKKPKGVTVKAQSDGTVTMLNIPGMTIINLHTYFDTKNDADFFDFDGYDPSSTLVSHQNKHLKNQSHPTKERASLLSHCNNMGKLCSLHILDYWKVFCQNILSECFFEVHGLTNVASASYLAFQCIWTTYAQKAGPMAQALEKCKPYHEDLLRQDSKGGFMFSIEDALDQGQTLWPNQDNDSCAQAIAEMDLVSAYGYAASQSYIPSGFCTGFGKMNPFSYSLEKLDKKLRHKTFEFQAIYKVLYNLVYQENVTIRSVYSNFSPLGLFHLGSYPIDLAVVTDSGQLLLYQMDGQWTHGCPASCDPLERYANGQTYEQVRKKTNKRDKDTWNWISALNLANNLMIDHQNQGAPSIKHRRFKYEIIYNCHSDGFSSGSLTFQYNNLPELAQVIQGYKITEDMGVSLTPTKLESLMANSPSKDFTFIAKAFIQVSSYPEELIHPNGPLVVYQPRKDKYTQQSLSYSGNVILTRDYYEWLKDSFCSVQLQELEWVLFYKTEPIFNQIYHHLVHLRSSTRDPVLICFLKRMINLSCGFFGAHTSQHNKTTYRLVDGPPSGHDFFRHYLNLDHASDVGQQNYMLLETKAWPKGSSQYRKVSSSALPMFVSIIEYGKLRLMQVLNFLQRHIHPSQFRLLYSNIDNLLFALGNANTVLEAIHPSRINSFLAEKNQFLVEESVKIPGKAHLEWIRNGLCGWKFISIRTQHYCLVVSDDDQGHLHKTSGWSRMSTTEAFSLAKDILAGRQIKLNQIRRINKKCNMDTHQVEFTYGPKPL